MTSTVKTPPMSLVAGLSSGRIAGDRACRARLPARPTGDVIGYERASLAHRLRSAYRRVHGRLQLHLGIYVSAEEDDVEGEIEPKGRAIMRWYNLGGRHDKILEIADCIYATKAASLPKNSEPDE
jgi:hypothetical protein